MAHPGVAFEDLAWLRQATVSIGAEYFAVAAHGRDAARARERVYGYELYHQARLALGDGEPLRLMGEIDKRGRATVSAAVSPDLVWHVPGDMDANRLVVEIKPATARASGVRKDLA